ncbi:MAG: M6 family metalloprotease domain-containing protein [Kiritimatiellia bacterium]
MKLLRASAVAVMMLAAVFVQTAVAAPFAKIVEFTQPNGELVQLWGEGDEFYAVFETLDGYTVLFDDATLAYVYADLNADGSALVSTGVLVGQNRPAGLPQHLRINPEEAQRQARARQEIWERQTGIRERWRALKRQRHNYERALAAGPTLMAPPATTGAIIGITLLIDFDDDPQAVTREEINEYCNAVGYTGYGNNGSVRDYYLDVSAGNLDYSNVITAYVRIPNTLHRKAYYLDPTRDAGESANELIVDALTILKEQPDFASATAPLIDQATLNNSGQALALNVFYTGGNGGVWRYGLWPHKWGLYEVGAQQITDRTSVFTYQITNMGDGLSIATFCHENGHMICGYPDLYDYDYDSIGGAGKFCLMGHGNFDKNPAQFCAYLKYASGWTTTVEVEPYTFVEASVASRMSDPDFNKIYRFGKPDVATEYYLFEGRSQADRDAGIPAAGLFIWHIDELGDRDDQRYAYNDQHNNYECSLVQADGLYHFQNNANSGDKYDSWYAGNSAANYSNRFKDSTTPSAKWWDGSNSRIHVGEIGPQADVMTFRFIPPLPVILSKEGPLPFGREFEPYSYSFGLAGDAGPVTWNVVNSDLPAGLTLGSTDGLISGLPTQATNAFFDVEVMTSYNVSITNSFSLLILPVHTIPYVEDFDSGNGLMPDSWKQVSLSNAVIWKVRQNSHEIFPWAAHTPTNMVMLISTTDDDSVTKLITPRIDFGEDARAGRLSFRHFMAGWRNGQDELRVYYKKDIAGEWELLETYLSNVSTWTERVVDLPAISRSVYIAFEGTARYGHGVCVDTIKVWDPTPPYGFVTQGLLPNAVLGESYDLNLVVEGGYTSYVFTVVSGTLPAGIALTPSGRIHGTPNTLQRTMVDIQVQDSRGQILVKTYSLAVVKPSVNLFEEDFESGGRLPYGWSQATAGNVSPWVFKSGGQNQHPPAAQHMENNARLFTGVSIPGTENNQVHTNRLITPLINLGQAPENITLYFWHCMEEWDGDQDSLNVYYQSTVGGPWNLLASYMQNTPQWTQRAVLLPDPSSTYSIAFEGIARFGYGVCIDNIRITDENIAPIITTERDLPSGLKGVAYATQFDASGGVAPYLWELADGAAPPGLSLSSEGLLSGVPTDAYNGNFFVRVVGVGGHSSTNRFNLQVRPVRGKPYFEDFENNGAMPDGWSAEKFIGNAEWVIASGTSVLDPTRSPAYAYSGSWNAVLYNPQSQAAVSKLISPMIDLGGGVINATLTFRHHMTKWFSSQDELKVYYRTSLTGPWVFLQAYNLNTPEWTERTLALPNPTATYFVAFEGWAQDGYGVCIDDVLFSGDAPSPYNDWLKDYFTEQEITDGLITERNHDPDGDGLTNNQEYVFVSDPRTSNNTANHILEIQRGSNASIIVIAYRRRSNDPSLHFVVEKSTDMRIWSDCSPWIIMQTQQPLSAEAVEERVTMISSLGRCFFRIKVYN